MKKKESTEEQIVSAVKQMEGGRRVEDPAGLYMVVCDNYGACSQISDARLAELC